MRTSSDINRELIRSFTDQPDQLPDPIRAEMADLWGDRQHLQLYALADLRSDHHLQEAWLLLGSRELTLVSGEPGNRTWQRVDRRQIDSVRELSGLSSQRLQFRSSDPDQPPLLEVYFSRRQRRAMENIKILVEAETPDEEFHEADALYADSVADPIRNAQAAIRGSERAVIWRLLRYLLPHRKDLLIGSAAAIGLTALSLIPPHLTGLIIDGVKQGDAYAGTSLWTYVIWMAAAFLLRGACLWVRLRRMALMGEKVAHDLRQEIYTHLQSLSLRFFTRKQTGSIISRCSSDTDRLWDFIAFGVIEVALSVLMLFGLGAVLLWKDLTLGLVMVLPVPFFLLAFWLHGRSMQNIFQKAWRKWADLTSVLSGTIPGIRVVKAFHQEQREINRFNRENDECLETFQKVHRVWTNFWPGLMLCFQVVTLVIWVFALPRLTGHSGPTLSLGTFVTFLLYTGMFMQPLETIGQMTRMMNRAVSSAHRIFEVLDTEPQIINVETPVTLNPVQGGIRFDQVHFSYDGVRQVLRDVSFEVAPGEMVGLVGPSGAGKSTITNLLARFYDVTGGRIDVDGVDIRQLEIGAYRRSLGMVLQEPYLFHGTIMDNIAYGIENPDSRAVIEAAKAAHAHEFICGFDQGYESLVGERGQTLSGGERQRISIARAILHNPRILILDEATSNVDTETERRIQEALDRLVKGRTVIAIAHRLSTLKRANRLLVVKDGKLVEQGTHDELLAIDNGVFRGLYDLQQELHQQFAV